MELQWSRISVDIYEHVTKFSGISLAVSPSFLKNAEVSDLKIFLGIYALFPFHLSFREPFSLVNDLIQDGPSGQKTRNTR